MSYPSPERIPKICCQTLQKWYIIAMAWTVQFLDDGVRAALETLPRDIRANFLRISRLIEAVGLPNVHEPYVKHLEGKLWEMRMKGRDGTHAPRMSPPWGTGWSWGTCSSRRLRKRRAVRSKRPFARPRRSSDAKVHPSRGSRQRLDEGPGVRRRL